MDRQPNISSTAFLIADSARAAMLMALLDGQAWTAGQLACVAGVTAQTASSHLGKLLSGGLLTVEIRGRYRNYRLAGPHVATALETLAFIGPVEPPRRQPLTRETQKLRFARCCYDHLAGRLGVAVTHRLREQGFLVPTTEKQFEVTPTGRAWFADVGLDTTRIKPTRQGFARQCLDWTERDHHLAGPLGVQFTRLLCDKGWIRRVRSSRAVDVTPKGWREFQQHLGLREHVLTAPVSDASKCPPPSNDRRLGLS